MNIKTLTSLWRRFTLLTVAILAIPAFAADPIKIGAVGPKTGPLAGGAAITYWPNVKLWVEDVNSRGGLKMADGSMREIELIEYDDQTNPQENIRSLQRLANSDKADFVLAPYGTGIALAAAPIWNRLGYPMINVSAITDQTDALTQRYDNVFFTLGKTTPFAEGAANVMIDLNSEGKVGNKVALVNVADAFGIELAKAAKPVFEQAGFEVVYDSSYPPTIQDISPVVNSIAAADPDILVAFSYPPDSFALTEQVLVQGVELDAFFTAVGTVFPAFGGRFGADVNGQFGTGGVNPDSPAFMEYAARHQQVNEQAPDYWASPVTYASFQVLEQAIEGVGSTDRDAVTEYIKNNSFDTVMGEWTFENQQIRNYWTVGQWQDGKFYGVGYAGEMDGAAEPIAR